MVATRGGSTDETKGAQAPLPPLIPWSPSKNFCHGYFEEKLEDEDDDKLATLASLNFHLDPWKYLVVSMP